MSPRRRAFFIASENEEQENPWKASTQRYEANVMLKTLEIKQSLDDGSYQPKKCKEFVLSERGKTRPVRAPGIEDRVVAKAHNQQILLPTIRRKIIYDNGASIKDRGNDYAKRRFETHVHKHYRQRGDNGGYVLFADFTKFFDNIPHEKLKEQFHKFTNSAEENLLTDKLIDSFRPDVSYMSDEEYALAMTVPYNSLKNINSNGSGERWRRNKNKCILIMGLRNVNAKKLKILKSSEVMSLSINVN